MKQKIDELIKESMKAKDTIRTKVLRAIKTEFMKVETAKDAKELDEIAVLRKMVKDRVASAQLYFNAGRKDLCSEEAKEADILSEFIPQGPTDNDIRVALTEIALEGTELIQKNMGTIMKAMKAKLPEADMKLVGEIAKSLWK